MNIDPKVAEDISAVVMATLKRTLPDFLSGKLTRASVVTSYGTLKIRIVGTTVQINFKPNDGLSL